MGAPRLPPRVPWPWLSGGARCGAPRPGSALGPRAPRGPLLQGVQRGRGCGPGFMLGSFPAAVHQSGNSYSFAALGLPCAAGILSSESCFPRWAVSKSLQTWRDAPPRPSRRLFKISKKFKSMASKGARGESLRM